MAIKLIKIETLPKKIALLAAAVFCLISIVFFIRWCLGNALASHTIDMDVADLAVSFAPADPQAHYTSAVLHERLFQPDNLAKSIVEYEQATALSPNDYRTWLALGRARERNGGDAAGAELALKKSLELAPNYSEVRWILGNVLLREGKTEEAFAEIRRAAESDARYVNPAVSTAWQIFGGDLPEMSRHIGDSATVNAILVSRLAKEKRFDEAFKIWNSLPAEERKTNFAENGGVLYNQLIEAKKYRDALQVSTQLGEAENFAVGKIFNGGFEKDVKATGAGIFEWQIQDGAQPQIGVDSTQRHEGERSLVLIFNSATGREFRAFGQTAAVEAGKKYGFELFYKSDLKTSATLRWEILDGSDGKLLAATAPILAASDWTNLKTEFTVPEKTEAVVIRLARESCKSTLCPISGRVWFDDISLVQ
ncbi:MAG: carbohydrate binding domain-containing protein [Acidobacteriota bacterium]|nr:carbohydrate binding domain-containing protein [Acidobacteriota bacterium]